jgi:hypothetical protein
VFTIQIQLVEGFLAVEIEWRSGEIIVFMLLAGMQHSDSQTLNRLRSGGLNGVIGDIFFPDGAHALRRTSKEATYTGRIRIEASATRFLWILFEGQSINYNYMNQSAPSIGIVAALVVLVAISGLRLYLRI